VNNFKNPQVEPPKEYDKKRKFDDSFDRSSDPKSKFQKKDGKDFKNKGKQDFKKKSFDKPKSNFKKK
jgi:hypothetical protein